MSRPPSTIYLERRTYRRRRMMDAARLLPVLGIFLFLVPLFRTGAAGDPALTAGGVIFIFAVWAGLIAAAVLLSRWLRDASADAPDNEQKP